MIRVDGGARDHNAGTGRPAVAAVVVVLTALVSLLRGQDANWDLRNYHLHNAWSLLEGRLGRDLAPAQLQSYFPPLLDLPYYLLVQHLPAPVAGAVMGALHGLVFVPLALVASRLLAGEERRDRLALLLALAGMASAAFLSELGNTMGDNSTAPLVLAALLLCLPAGAAPVRATRGVFAGALLGLAVGLKLTNALYAPALGLAVLAAPWPWRQRLQLATALTLATVAVVALVAGPWLAGVWGEFGNPLFPQLNTLFQAPLAAADSTADLRWRPRGPGEALAWPVLFTLDPHRISEIALPQIGWALLFLAWPVALVATLLRRRATAAHAGTGERRAAVRMAGVFFVAAFVCWMCVFSIHRYLVVLELLAPLMLWMLLRAAWPSVRGRRFAGAAVAAGALVALAGWNDWGHARWSRQAFVVERPQGEAPGTVLLVGDEPHSWRLPYLWPQASYAGVASNFPESPAYRLRVRAMIGEGDALALLVAPADADEVKARARDRKTRRYNRIATLLALDRGGCPLMRRAAGRGRTLLEPEQSPSGRCSFAIAAAPPGVEEREQRVRSELGDVAARLQSGYGLALDVAACRRYDSRIGDEHFPYRLCPVALHSSP